MHAAAQQLIDREATTIATTTPAIPPVTNNAMVQEGSQHFIQPDAETVTELRPKTACKRVLVAPQYAAVEHQMAS
ncbi:unnamed protein product, partial [Ceratitis capitata]